MVLSRKRQGLKTCHDLEVTKPGQWGCEVEARQGETGSKAIGRGVRQTHTSEQPTGEWEQWEFIWVAPASHFSLVKAHAPAYNHSEFMIPSSSQQSLRKPKLRPESVPLYTSFKVVWQHGVDRLSLWTWELFMLFSPAPSQFAELCEGGRSMTKETGKVFENKGAVEKIWGDAECLCLIKMTPHIFHEN